MWRLREFLASSHRFKLLLTEALVRLWAASLLRLLPLPRRTQFLMREYRVSSRPRAVPSVEEICRVVDAAARFVPGATCLVKAQAACAMLNRFGYAAEIRVGVLKNSSNLDAHAWVEHDESIVMGRSTNPYVQLPKMVRATGKPGLPGT